MRVVSRGDARHLGILPDPSAEPEEGIPGPTPEPSTDARPLPPKGLALLRTPSLDDPVGIDLHAIRAAMGKRVPDEDHPGQWKDREPEPEPTPVAPSEPPEPEPYPERTFPLTAEQVGLDDEGPLSEADMVEELLRRSGAVRGSDAKTTTPPYAYWVLDGSEVVQEPYARPKRLRRIEKDPMMRDLMAGQVVFVMGESPYSLSELYRKARRRQFKLGMRLVRLDGIVGTVLHNAGWLHLWSEKRPIGDVLDGSGVRHAERPTNA